MTEHLTADEVRLLARHQLKGAARVRILLHLESCAECRRRLTEPTKEELLERLTDKSDKSPQLKPEDGE